MKNYEKMDDEMLLRLAAMSINENAIAEYEALEDGKDLITEKEIAKQWDAVMKKHRQRKYHRMLSSLRGEFLKKAAAVIAALSVLGGGITATVAAVNPQIRDLFDTDFEDHSVLSVIFSDKRPEIPEEWDERYYPTYMPNDFVFFMMDESKMKNELIYRHKESLIHFSIYPMETNSGINTEDMLSTPISINTIPSVLYSDTNDTKSILVMNYFDCIVCISGSIQSSETILIGESVKTNDS